MFSIIQEYLSNQYILPLIATIIGLVLLYLYDLFEKKQYTNAVYFRVAVLIYVSCLATIYISRLPFLQVGGGGNVELNPSNPGHLVYHVFYNSFPI